MKKEKTKISASKVISMSAKTKEKINAVANTLKGKELFPDKIEGVKQTLKEIKSLPM